MKEPRCKFIITKNCCDHKRQRLVWWESSCRAYHFVSCGICGSNGPIRKTINGAIKAWNRINQ